MIFPINSFDYFCGIDICSWAIATSRWFRAFIGTGITVFADLSFGSLTFAVVYDYVFIIILSELLFYNKIF